MKLEKFKTQTEETVVELEKGQLVISVSQWGNMEGVNLMMTGKDLSLRLAAALTWEELDGIVVALSAARA